MARTVAELPSGTRITDYISLGVLTKTFPMATIEPILQETGRTGVRQRICRHTWLCTMLSLLHCTCSPRAARFCVASWRESVASESWRDH